MRAIDADAFKEYCKTGLNETKTMIRSGSMRAFAEELTSAFIRDIDEQPTVEPEQRTGEWIPQDHNKRAGNISTCVYYYPTCSKCGQVGNDTYKYCPHCGAKMISEGKNCDCYRDGTCIGTKEIDQCSCGGDKSKCDFYEHVRQ